jgi:phosphatidylglycerol lysyltransferase
MMTSVTTQTTAELTAPSRLASGISFLRRVPFTASMIGLILLVGLCSGTLWNGLEYRPLFQSVGYGLPAFQDGRWWTLITGSLYAAVPLQYISILGVFALFVGTAELLIGTKKAALAAIGGQLFAVLGAAGIVFLLNSTTTWPWSEGLRHHVDVGWASGAMCALGAATAVMRAPWGARVRLQLLLYTSITLLYIGVLWDIQHLLGLLLGLAIGPFLAGRHPRLGPPRVRRDEWRLIASVLFTVAAAIRLVLFLVPSNGPLGAITDDNSLAVMLISAAISLALAYGLARGKRVAWRWAVAYSGLVVVVLAVIVLPLAIIRPFGPDFKLSAGAVPALTVSILLWVVQFGVLVIGRRAFHSPSKRKLRKTGSLLGDTRTVAVDLLRRDGGTSLSWMTTWSGNHWYAPAGADGQPRGYIAYQLHQGAAIALGDAIAPTHEERLRLLDSFVDYWDKQGRVPCLFSVTSETADWAEKLGWQRVQVADEAVIDLPDLEFKGKAWQDIRTALNRAGKEGVEYRSGRLGEMPRGVLMQVRAISQDWVGDKSLPEMGFTLGGVDEALDPEVMVGLAVDTDGTIHGVTSWLPVFSPGGEVHAWTLDVMRRLPDGFRPTTEFLIASACLEFQEQGCSYVSLSGAPLAHSRPTGDPAALDQLLGWLGNTLEPVYGFRSLESFKAKFKPRHNPLYLVFKEESQLPRIGLALTRAYVPDASLRELAAAGLRARREGG